MELISWLLSLLGLGSDRAMHKSNQRAEASRLNAEVAGEVGRALDILSAAMPRLTRRCTQLCGENSEMCNDMIRILNEQRDNALQILEMTNDIKSKISNPKSRPDWDRVLSELYVWRANASRIAPWIQDLVSRYDTILYEAGAR